MVNETLQPKTEEGEDWLTPNDKPRYEEQEPVHTFKEIRDPKTNLLMKGSCLNPSGSTYTTRTKERQRLFSITDELRRQLLMKPRGQCKTYLQLLVKSALNKAIKGQDPRMIKEIIDRVDGLPTQKIQIDAELRIEELANQLKLLVADAVEAELIEQSPVLEQQDEAEKPLERPSEAVTDDNQPVLGKDGLDSGLEVKTPAEGQ